MSTNDTDRALSAPIAERGRALLDLPEDQWFDRKSARVSARDLAQTICAFANAEGGTIVIGLHDGLVEGTKNDPRHMNSLRQASVDFISPPARVHVDQLACAISRGGPDALLVIRVPPGETVHEMSNGDCYLRVGDESRKLGFAQRQELHYDRGTSQFDGAAVPGIHVDELDPTLLKQYRESAGFSGSNTQLLRNRGLLTNDGTVTTGGYLLFAAHPSELLPQAVIRIVRYRSVQRGTGSQLNTESGYDARVEGPIPQAILNARDIIRDWQPRRTALDETGRFSDQPVVPVDAWLEGLVNAVVHRSYSLAGDHIRVEIFPDRIEVSSPGRFPGLADPSNPLDISRYARNPRIARVCTDLRLTRELGEGIKRMFEEMRMRGLTDPIYTQTTGAVKLTLSGMSRIPSTTLDRLPRGSLTTLNALRAAQQPLGTGELQELVGVSRPTLIRQLNALRDEELVSWTGKSARDPRAAWIASP